MNALPCSSGVQLHPTSLPGGRLGPEAYAFVDWLADAGQTWWQMLPLGPPDRYGSPYKARVGVRRLAGAAGVAARAGVERRGARLPRARRRTGSGTGIGFGRRGAVADQVRFDREWAALRALRGRARRAADRRRPDLRRAGQRRPPRAPGAVPATGWWPARRRTLHRQGPAVGQPALRLAGAAAPRLPLVDRARCGARSSSSTSRGSTTSAASSPTGRCRRGRAHALCGHWKRGPGRALFDAAARGARAALPLIAEDLGVITPAVERLRDVARAARAWSCCSSASTRRRRERRTTSSNHVEDRVVYTGTHDHDTVRGWYESLPAERRALVDASRRARPACASAEPWWSLIRLAFSSPARVAMVQAQDVLGLGSEARMNKPGTTAARGGGGWTRCRSRGSRAAAASGDRGRGTYLDSPRPMAAPATSHEILDVNRRYHDVAADDYDAKWGIDFGAVGQAQVLGKLTKLLGAHARPVRALARDRRGHRLLLAQPPQRGCRRSRPPAPTSRRACSRRSRPMRDDSTAASRPPPATPPSCRSRTRRSTSCSATPCCTTCPSSSARSPSSRACCARRDAVLRRRAVAPGRPHRRLAEARRHARRAAVAQARCACARRSYGANGAAPSSHDTEHALESVVDVHAFDPGDLEALMRRRGLRGRRACAARSSSPTGSAGSTARSEASANHDDIP